MSNRMYKTLPTAFRGRGETTSSSDAKEGNGGGNKRRTVGDSPPPPFFNLNLGISNLISGGMNFLGQLRRNKTPSSTPVHSVAAALAKASFSSSSAGSSPDTLYFEACEHIELCSFPSLPEAAGEGQTGEGHLFSPIGSFNPTWCDLCGDLVWGLYDTGASKCVHCHYTCHVKCQRKVRLNCSILQNDLVKECADEATLADVSSINTEEVTLPPEQADSESASQLLYQDCNKTLRDVEHIEMVHDDDDDAKVLVNTLPLDSELLFGQDLDAVVADYNASSPLGQETVLENGSSSCRGFIRVQLNLRRPINVIMGTRPPSIYNVLKEDTLVDKTLTSFYLPSDTVKALHVTSETTTRDVIRSLLDKFRVADTPHKYAMYEKTLRGEKDDDEGATLSRVRMRKLKNDERPLVLALLWCKEGAAASGKYFVLQENDPGEISWDSFSVPELKNFLLILDREEAWYKKRIHDKYEAVRVHMNTLVKEKRPS